MRNRLILTTLRGVLCAVCCVQGCNSVSLCQFHIAVLRAEGNLPTLRGQSSFSCAQGAILGVHGGLAAACDRAIEGECFINA